MTEDVWEGNTCVWISHGFGTWVQKQEAVKSLVVFPKKQGSHHGRGKGTVQVPASGPQELETAYFPELLVAAKTLL